MSPLDGEIVEVNANAVHNHDLVVTDPYGAGWLVRIKVGPNTGDDCLMSAAAYEQTVRRRRR